MVDPYDYIPNPEDPKFVTIYELEPFFKKKAIVTPEIIRDRVVARVREHREDFREELHLAGLAFHVSALLIVAITEGRCERRMECIREMYPLASYEILM